MGRVLRPCLRVEWEKEAFYCSLVSTQKQKFKKKVRVPPKHSLKGKPRNLTHRIMSILNHLSFTNVESVSHLYPSEIARCLKTIIL